MVRPAEAPSSKASGAERAAQAVRSMIAERELQPGDQLRQDELATRIGQSRATLREALQALAVERLISYSRNRGYTVSRFGAGEMQQLYELRDFAEARLLQSIPTPSEAQLAPLVELNEQIKEHVDDAHRVFQLNDEFHLRMFELSPLQIIALETQRWWQMSAAYRSLSVTTAPRRLVIAEDHDEMIDALRTGDTERLVRVGYVHRHASLDRIVPVLL